MSCGIVGMLLLLLAVKCIVNYCRDNEHDYEIAGFPAVRLETEMIQSEMYNGFTKL